MSVSQARFSDGYWPLRNRFAILVETHPWKDYPTRVRVTRNAIESPCWNWPPPNGAQWMAAARGADQRAARIGGTSVALAYANTDHVKTIDFRGYGYTRQASAISGGLATRYDNDDAAHLARAAARRSAPSIAVVAPRGGYIVPAADASWVGEKLALHGIASRLLASGNGAVDVEVFRATKAMLAPATFEGTPSARWRASGLPNAAPCSAGSAVRANRSGEIEARHDAARAART